MWSSRASLGVAQIAFYIPPTALSIYLATRHGPPRLGWIFMAILSLLRIAAGALLIVGGVLDAQDPDAFIYFGVYDVLIHVTFFQLLATTVGLFRIIKLFDYPDEKRIGHTLRVLRILSLIGFLVATVGARLQVIPGSLEMHTAADDMFMAGAIIAVVIVLCYAGLTYKAWAVHETLSTTSQKIVLGVLPTIALYVLRVIWFCLAAFSTAETWNQIFGSLGAFIGMALLPEYLILAIHVYIGFAIPIIPKPSPATRNDNSTVEPLNSGKNIRLVNS